jgi:hypothetical protein
MSIAWLALLLSLAALAWQAWTWWHGVATRVRVDAVIFLQMDSEEGYGYWVGTRVTNRGRSPVVLRATGFYWRTDDGFKPSQGFSPESGTPIQPGDSYIGLGPQRADWSNLDPEHRYQDQAAGVGWAQLGSGRIVESRPGLIFEPLGLFPIRPWSPVEYRRAETFGERALRTWLGVAPDLSARAPSRGD